jgi:hypothetical protein
MKFISAESGNQGFSRYDCTLVIFLVRVLTKTNIGDCTVGDESLETELLIAISRFFLGSLLTGDKLFTKDLPIPTSRSPLSLIAARSRSSHSTLTSLPFMCMTEFLEYSRSCELRARRYAACATSSNCISIPTLIAHQITPLPSRIGLQTL